MFIGKPLLEGSAVILTCNQEMTLKVSQAVDFHLQYCRYQINLAGRKTHQQSGNISGMVNVMT